MTYEEISAIQSNAPLVVRCIDGKFGLLVSVWPEIAGVQVMGEDGVRKICYEWLLHLGNGTLIETPTETKPFTAEQAVYLENRYAQKTHH